MIRQILRLSCSILLSAAAASSFFLAGCNQSSSNPPRSAQAVAEAQIQPSTEGIQTNAVFPDSAAAQQHILQAQSNRCRKTELTVGAFVARLLPDDRKGLPHERFLIGLSNGSTVLVAHDTAMAPYVPLHAGDYVVIHGEYKWTEKGGILHWTHHSDTSRHEGGWIDYAGNRYQ